MLASTPHDPSRLRLLLGDHLEVLEAMPAARDRGCAELLDDALERVDHGGDGRVADHVESRR